MADLYQSYFPHDLRYGRPFHTRIRKARAGGSIVGRWKFGFARIVTVVFCIPTRLSRPIHGVDPSHMLVLHVNPSWLF